MNSKKSNSLPDGNYQGRVYISADAVSDENSLDYGRKKFVIELMPTGEKFKDETVILNRVMMPHYLANEPPKTDEQALNEWRGASKLYLQQTNDFLEKCGVNVSDMDGTRFVQQIAQNNISRPIVNFSMKGGVPTIHNLVSREKPEALNAEPEDLPDGNDLPL